MQFVSIYRLAELCDVKTDRLDVFFTRDLQSALKKLYNSDDLELYQVGELPVTLEVAMDWLWKMNSTDSLNFCQWIHEIPGLEAYLETNNLDLTKSIGIPDKIRKSFNFSRFGSFLDPILLPQLERDIKSKFEQKDYVSLNQLIELSTLLSKTNSVRLNSIIANGIVDLESYFSKYTDVGIINDSSDFQFLISSEFQRFLDKSNAENSLLIDRFKSTLASVVTGLKSEKDVELKNKLISSFQLKVQEQFETPKIKIVQDKPSIPKPPPKKVTHIKQANSSHSKNATYPKSVNRPKISPLHIVGIAFGVFALIFKIAMHYSTDSYDYTNNSWPSYDEAEFGSSGYFSDYNWDNNIELLKTYVQENEDLTGVSVNKKDDWYNAQSEKSVSEPFIEHFYPLYNKDGVDGFNIINESNYAIILLVKGEEDTYSYMVESRSSYEEYFSLDKEDELIFYFGKEFEETEDLSDAEILGFHFVDRNSLIYLDSVYSVGYGINPDYDNKDESFDYEIKIIEKDGTPLIQFDYYRTIKTGTTDLF